LVGAYAKEKSQKGRAGENPKRDAGHLPRAQRRKEAKVKSQRGRKASEARMDSSQQNLPVSFWRGR